MQNTMPQAPRISSPVERRVALWVLIAAVALAALIGVAREALPPSLGAWDQGASTPAPPGVIDARPVATPAAADAHA
jgi:hypothetical protein